MSSTEKLMKLAFILGILISLTACALEDKKSIDFNKTDVQSSKMSGLNWTYGSGAVAPPSQYSVSYEIDFQLRKLVVTVTSGASATNLPAPGTKALTDHQLNTIRNLYTQIAIQNCATGSMVLGGSTDSISVSTNSLAVADLIIYGVDCTGNAGSNGRQADANGYRNLTNYLKSL